MSRYRTHSGDIFEKEEREENGGKVFPQSNWTHNSGAENPAGPGLITKNNGQEDDEETRNMT